MTDSTHWIEWQRDHLLALQALQDAQRVYHRAVSDHAFATPASDAETATRDALLAMDLARVRLDEVRSRQPR